MLSCSVFTLLFGLGAILAGPVSATPIGSDNVVDGNALVKRADHPLWDGKPKWEDIKQDKFNNDWFLAAAAALANSNPQKIQDRFTEMKTLKKRDATNVDSVKVELYHIDDKKWVTKDVDYSSITADYSGMNNNWWIAALEKAGEEIRGNNGINEDGFTDGDANWAYTMLTGEEGVLYETDRDAKTYKREMWTALENANKSCICILTGPNADSEDGNLKKDTWYAVLETEGDQFDSEGNEIGGGHVHFVDIKKSYKTSLSFEALQDDIKYYSKPKYLMPDPDIEVQRPRA